MARTKPQRRRRTPETARGRPPAAGGTGGHGEDAARNGAGTTGRPPALVPAERAALVERALAAAPPGPDSFPGCKAIRLTQEQFFERDERNERIEYWDADRETAWKVRDGATIHHELPAQKLAQLVERIAALRGAPIRCYGTVTVLVRDPTGAPRRALQPDQCVYLHRPQLQEPRIVVGVNPLPDVILEVDHTTDVRRYKLGRYEEWGFPEVWVEVPDSEAKSRPRGLRPGLTIHLLGDGGYRPSPASLAFPGWTAAAIHLALNEEDRSARTHSTLERVGRTMGARIGKGPEDDPLLRSQRAEGRAQGREEDRAGMVRAILSVRGISVSTGFDALAPALATHPRDAVAAAALACASEADLRARLGIGG